MNNVLGFYVLHAMNKNYVFKFRIHFNVNFFMSGLCAKQAAEEMMGDYNIFFHIFYSIKMCKIMSPHQRTFVCACVRYTKMGT